MAAAFCTFVRSARMLNQTMSSLRIRPRRRLAAQNQSR
jgi:hypothetical protein